MNNVTRLPFYAKATILLVGMFVLFAVLYIMREIIVPLVFSVILAIVLHPVVVFLHHKGMNRLAAIIITLFIAFLLVGALCFFLFSQGSRFSESSTALVDKFTDMLHQFTTWASGYLDIHPQKINAWIAKTKTEVLNSSSAAIAQTLMIVGNGLVIVLLVPVYIFMLLFYQPLLVDSIRRFFSSEQQSMVNEIITQIKTVIQQYLVGLIIEAALVAMLNSVVLLILGVPYALLLGVIGALLNVIPYIGGIIAVAIPMIVAIATKPTAWYAIYVLIGYYIVQLIDNNYIVPKIVASKVQINALFAIIVVLAGNALWGIAGMFLALPLIAIVKLICDRIDPLKPVGYMLGDTMPQILKIKGRHKRKSKQV